MNCHYLLQFSSVQLLSRVRLFATPWIAVRQASLPITNSRSSPVSHPSSQWCHLILCRPLFLLPPIPSSINVFSNESTLRMRWPKYWSFRIVKKGNSFSWSCLGTPFGLKRKLPGRWSLPWDKLGLEVKRRRLSPDDIIWAPASCHLLWNVWLCHFSPNSFSSPNLPNTTATITEAPLSPSPECQWHFLPGGPNLKWSLRHLKLNQTLPEGKNEQSEVTVLSSQPGKRERTNRAGC